MVKKNTRMFTSGIYQLYFSWSADAFVFIIEVFQLICTMYLSNLVSEQSWCLLAHFHSSWRQIYTLKDSVNSAVISLAISVWGRFRYVIVILRGLMPICLEDTFNVFNRIYNSLIMKNKKKIFWNKL